MKYMGSKNRIAKHILPIILKSRKPEQWYVEPFVGGANIIDKVTGNRKAADNNEHVIDALCFIRDGDIPKNNKEFTEASYNLAADMARNGRLKSFEDGLYCYALIVFSFGAKWIGGWSRGKNSKGEQRDCVAEQYRANTKQKPLLQGVWFEHSSYDELEIPVDSIIYCDSPYKGTTQYKDKFDHEPYWEWCREQVKKGHKVFVSEYSAPDDFVCVWSQELNCSVAKNGGHKKTIEKLFVHETQIGCSA